VIVFCMLQRPTLDGKSENNSKSNGDGSTASLSGKTHWSQFRPDFEPMKIVLVNTLYKELMSENIYLLQNTLNQIKIYKI